jgi:hypothetical protein
MAVKFVRGNLPCIHLGPRRGSEWCSVPDCHGIREYRDWSRIWQLVDQQLNASEITVVAFEDNPDQIMGWAAKDATGAVEWMYLRAAFKDAMSQARPIVWALLGKGDVVFRRAPQGILEAVVAAGLTPRVVPECL